MIKINFFIICPNFNMNNIGFYLHYFIGDYLTRHKSNHHPTNKKPLYNNKVPFVDIQSVFLLDFSYNKSSPDITVYLLMSLSCYCLAFLISGLLGGLRRLNSSLFLSSSSFNDQGLLQNLHCPSP